MGVLIGFLGVAHTALGRAKCIIMEKRFVFSLLTVLLSCALLSVDVRGESCVGALDRIVEGGRTKEDYFALCDNLCINETLGIDCSHNSSSSETEALCHLCAKKNVLLRPTYCFEYYLKEKVLEDFRTLSLTCLPVDDEDSCCVLLQRLLDDMKCCVYNLLVHLHWSFSDIERLVEDCYILPPTYTFCPV